MGKEPETILITPREAMKIIGCSRHTMYEVFLKDEEFPKIRIGNRFFINKARLQDYMDKKCS
ncbi:MAG: hypothetical protein PWP67_2619 [Clostridium butyricum]|nr:hypothetical protein [Clostridium butyricum]